VVVTHPLKDFIIKFKAGEEIYSEGDAGAEMFIVQSGSVRVFRSLSGGVQELAVMEKGDFFGEMSVLEGTSRTASARALEDCELIEINSTVFDRMIRGNIEIAVRMLRKLSARLQQANHKIEEMFGAPEAEPALRQTPAQARSSEEMGPAGALPAPDSPGQKPEIEGQEHELDGRQADLQGQQPDIEARASGAKAPPAAPHREEETGADKVIPFGPDWLGVLVLSDGIQVFPIRGENSLIGRYDPVTGTRPEIDLTAYDTNRSVSRRHAKVTSRDGSLFVSEEVGALNGTFLNGKRLTPGKAESIRDGDTLALGMVTLRFQGKAKPD
jgi:pSer/pThr/pTyr-binding forkhead associated (FHA) protein